MIDQASFEKNYMSLHQSVNKMSEGAAKVALFCALLTMEMAGTKEMKQLYEKTCQTYTEAAQRAR